MKNILLIFVVLLGYTSVYGQAPEQMSYQAILRDAADALIVSQGIGMQVSVLQGSSSGTAVYVETHSGTTNANGLVSLEIGGGTPTTGTFSGIDWSSGGPYFLKTETDPTASGGTSYTITGTTELLSVPFALHAKTSSEKELPSGGTEGQILTINASGNPEWKTILKVGQAHPTLGGIIFHLDASGEHGLLAAAVDQSSGAPWGCSGFDIQSITERHLSKASFGGVDGAGNPISQCTEVGSANALCTALGTEWYLPSLGELNLMYRTIGPGAPAPTNTGGFAAVWYWSSTEVDAPALRGSRTSAVAFRRPTLRAATSMSVPFGLFNYLSI